MKKQKILLVGSEGNMGQRYQTIFRLLGVDVIRADPYYTPGPIFPKHNNFDGILIASPTYLHYCNIKRVTDYNKPILCEKPVVTTEKNLLELTHWARTNDIVLQVVNQYRFMPSVGENITGDSGYNYFKTGGDGLPWDAMSIIALARGDIKIGNTSPVWTCTINGIGLDLGCMDAAYINMIKAWVESPADLLGFEFLKKSHQKIFNIINGEDKRCEIIQS